MEPTITSSPLQSHSKPPIDPVDSAGSLLVDEVDKSELLTLSSSPLVVQSESLELAITDNVSAAMSSPQVTYSEPPLLNKVSNLPVGISEPLETTPESQVSESEPLVAEREPQDRSRAGRPPVVENEPAVEAAIATEESPHLNRRELGKLFKKSHEAIRQWELTGKLTQMGWEPVPGTGGSPKNPRLYRRDRTSTTF